MMKSCTVKTPIGTIRLVSGPGGLVESSFVSAGAAAADPPDDPCLLLARDELNGYFAGTLRVFTVRLDLSGLTDFSRRVIEALQRIPYGSTVTYGELARRAGSPHAARAVGRVMATNRLPVIVPCHRVIAATGEMSGYSGGDGIATKMLLLEHEKSH